MRRNVQKLSVNSMVKTFGLSEFYLRLANLPQEVILDAVNNASETDHRAMRIMERMRLPQYSDKTALMHFQDLNYPFKVMAEWVMHFINTVNKLENSKAMMAIVRDMEKDARSKKRRCKPCKGLGKLKVINLDGTESEQLCVECEGDGHIMVPGHGKTRENLMKFQGMISDSGTSINIDNRQQTLNATPVADIVARANKALTAPEH